MNTAEKALRQLYLKSIREHYECEDCWYSCPKSREGSCNDEPKDKCTCGADDHNREIRILYEIIREVK